MNILNNLILYSSIGFKEGNRQVVEEYRQEAGRQIHH
jgi:hypothetical protein